MNTDTLSGMARFFRAGFSLMLFCVAPAFAQVLSSPLGSLPASSAAPPLASGQGPGVHSPLSSFAPLKPRDDIVPWSVLTDVKTKLVNRRSTPVFPMSVMALHRKTQRVQGFMLPLDPGEQQRHFLLASVPPTCSFCMPGGPESMVEVRTREPVKYTFSAVVVEGEFRVLLDDPSGLYYRMNEAVGVK